jgi:hypothetical protein
MIIKLLKDFEEFKDGAEERSKRLVQILESSLTNRKPLGFEGILERNSEEKNWKTRINTDDVDIPDSFLSS